MLGKGNANFQLHDVNGNSYEVILSNAPNIQSYKQIFSVSAATDRRVSVNLNRRGILKHGTEKLLKYNRKGACIT